MKMRKICAALALPLAALVIAGAQPAAAGFGVGTDLSYWKMDAADFKKDMSWNQKEAVANGDSVSGKIEQGVLNPELKVFYEHPLKDNWSIGGSVGFGKPASVEYSGTYRQTTPALTMSSNAEGKGWNIPVFLYAAKRMEKLAFSGGLGLNYHWMKTSINSRISNGLFETGNYKSDKFIPMVAAGGEYFLRENFSLGLNLKYLFSGKVDDFRGNVSGVLLKQKLVMERDALGQSLDYIPASQPLTANQRMFGYDMSGLRIAVAAKYYFGGR